jgi:hypothetical protein
MRHPSRVVSLALALSALGLSGVLLAQPPGPPAPMTFGDLDKNSDGVVTEQELSVAQGERMAARAAEGAPMRGAANPPAFADFDRNGDGKLTPNEFAAAQADRRRQPLPAP